MTRVLRSVVSSASLRAAAGAVLLLLVLVAPAALGQDTIEPPLEELPPPGPVPNSLQQAYFGVHAPDGSDVATEDFFFTGESADQLNKATGTPTATFARDEPTGSESIEQTSDNVANSDVPGDPLALFWTGEYSGELDTELELRWWFTSANAVQFVVANPVEVTVFADPDLASGEAQPERIIGRAEVQIEVGPQPTLNVSRVSVEGAVNERLHIQAKPLFSDAGRDLRVSYGSAATPSGFGVVLGDAAGGALQTVPADYDGEPLTLQRSYVGRESAEPTVGVLSDGETAFYASGAFDALPGQSPYQLARTEVLRSTDGGLTWESVQPELPGGVTTDPVTTLDPYVYVDPDTDRVFNPELYAGCTNMHYSDDAGETWETNRLACGDFVNDHQSVFTGPPPEGVETDGYPNVLYYCFNRVLDANCGRSLDGGASFQPTIGEPAFLGFDPEAGGLCGGLHGHVHVDGDGRLFMPKGHCGTPWIGVSEDGGESWERIEVSDMNVGQHTHLAVATDDADNVYFLWWDAERRLPWLSVSTDHGRTWTEPLMVAPPGVHEANFPILDAGAPGHIAMTFPGGTQPVPEEPAAAALRPWNSYVVVSTNATDERPLFLSASANDPDDPIHRGVCDGRCAGMFDFLELKISSAGEAWATATDTCMTLQNDCVGADSPDDDNDNDGTPNDSDLNPNSVALDAQGIAIRQIGGPNLRPAPTGPGAPGGDDGPADPVSAAPDDGDDAGLPATGGGLAAAALLLAGLALVRRRR